VLLTPKEVAARLRVSPRTVYLWLEEGRLPAVRLSERVTRIPSEAVDAFVADAMVAAEARAAYAAGGLLGRLRARRDDIARIAARRHARNLRVFGSVARGEESAASDIDLLVDFDADASLFDLGGLAVELTELVGVSVDVTPARDLKPLIRDRVLREAVPL
jgi:hypothetical protein